MRKTEYDFWPGNYISFPSSIKLFNDEETGWAIWQSPVISVTPESSMKVEVHSKQENILTKWSLVRVDGFDGEKWRWVEGMRLPLGSTGWVPRNFTFSVPSDIRAIKVGLSCTHAVNGVPAIAWFDDLGVYQDGVLIYANDFTAPLLRLAMSVAGPLTVGAGAIIVSEGLRPAS